MFDPLYGLATISSWTPTLDPSTTVITTTTTTFHDSPASVFHTTPSGTGQPTHDDDTDSLASYWLRVLIKISILAGWFSERLRSYARLAQEACAEASEERRLRSLSSSSSTSLASHSVLKRPAPGAPETFPKFGLLPAELRQQIWTEALPRSRLLLLELPSGGASSSPAEVFHALRKRSGRARKIKKRGGNIFTCATPPPTLLHVNHESRLIALKHYRLGLAPRGHPCPKIYVNLQKDVIGLCNEVMESPAGKNLIRLTPDLRLAKNLCLASASSASFLAGRQANVLESVEDIAIVDSALFAVGLTPKIAGLDWGYWIRWQIRQKRARWGMGGEGKEVGMVDHEKVV
ncbi:hypothetical protein QBC35DRAFT_470665 [Podospora australis]|uniref:2EXR domain-containing protein n=1 Tax=Podospora australis TaxID=1536484 RepID=A0AAN6X0I4_9PEZI|nr:hypothetical protein QBC35DRAFT_470665 [Podospora australis]